MSESSASREQILTTERSCATVTWNSGRCVVDERVVVALTGCHADPAAAGVGDELRVDRAGPVDSLE